MQIRAQTTSNGISPQLPPGDDFTRLILKLRWIGLDDEACRLQRVVQSVAPEQRPTVLSEPDSTD
jgi:hypothetical protein